MYRILLKLKRFIQHFLKVRSESRQTQITRTRGKIYRILMLLMASILIALLYPADDLYYPVDFPRKGEIAYDDIIAPFQLTISKSAEELAEERESAANAVPIIIEYNEAIIDSSMARFRRFMDAAAREIRLINDRDTNDMLAVPETAAYIDSVEAGLANRFPYINALVIRRLLLNGETGVIKNRIEDIIRNTIYFHGVIADLNMLPEGRTNSVVIRIGNREVYQVRDKLLDPYRANRAYRSALKEVALSRNLDIDFYYDLGRPFIIPNLTVNAIEMETRKAEVMAEISTVSEIISAGDIIVRGGSRVNEQQERILEEIFTEQRANADESSWYKAMLPVVARLALVLIAFVLMYLYLSYFHQLIFQSNPALLALFLIFGLEIVLIYIAQIIEINMSLSFYIYPIAIFSILITVLFDAEVGVVNTFILATLLGILHRFNFSLALMVIVVGTVACYSTQRVRHRAEFFKSALYLGLTYVLLILLLDSFKLSPDEDIVGLIGQGLFSAIVSPLLAMGILPVFESVFGLTTDITLLELSDMNHPLLKRLALEAPGTYHHSILVGNLAESAAKTISANPLLARVGAYYHDIGKMEIPEYFVENQLGIKSRHDNLTPTMSSIILSSHVKKGRLLGEDAGLPDEVLNFVEEHHGTMVMSYFLNKAREQGVENPNIDEFRYPGPKPRTRETAIVMLADSVEAASRTLAEPKPARLRNLVQNIISDRFQSGELEECPLTLKDLANIRESFVQILIGVFHHRVVYPKDEKKE